ncbi:MAG: hypothetical protein GXO57_00385 [Thermodesulfobacteria bacterium]|nr:hypothetical protein [Thermodesulfobacteriota bacterium]
MLKLKIENSTVFLLPFFPENLETSLAVAHSLIETKPSAIAICLPYYVKNYWIIAVKTLPTISVLKICYKDSQEYLFVTPICALVEATRLSIKLNIPLYFIDLPENVTEPTFYNIADLPSYVIPHYTYSKYTEVLIKKLPSKEVTKRVAFIGEKLIELAKNYDSVCAVIPFSLVKTVISYLKAPKGLLYLPPKYPENIEIFELSPKSKRELLVEPGFFHKVYEKNRDKLINEKKFLDRACIWEKVLNEAIQKFQKETNTILSPRDLEILGKYLRNYLLQKKSFMPDLMDLLVVTRGIGGDELAFWFWETATSYDLKHPSKRLPEIYLSPEELNLPYKNLRFSKIIKNPRKKFTFLKKYLPPEERKELAKKFKGRVVCSFPPEDLVVETFGKKAMEKGLKVITENLRKLEPFTSSLKDGLDIRETIKNWGIQETPYVIEEPTARAKAGSVVIIFEDDPDPITHKEKYPWNFTWHGEHHQESDMAFYATNPAENIIGPGIARAKYGGFMLTYPPMRVYDIWADPYFDIASSKAERLLLAGIDYSLEKYIIYIAKKPPSTLAKRFASIQGKKVIFLPIGSFSRTFLEKIRIFHVLEGHHVRLYAHKYINK